MVASSVPSDLTAVILAGGQGTRLRPFTSSLPKPLVPVGDRPIIEILLTRLRKAGVNRVVLAVNHLADQVEAALGDGRRFGLDITYSHEPRPLSTVGPLALIESLPEHFLVGNGDIVTDLDCAELVRSHLASQCQLTVATKMRRDKIDYGVLEIGQDNRVTGFQEKPTVSHAVSMGLYVFSREVLSLVPKGEKFGFDDLMHTLLERRIPINTYTHDGYWLDIGRVEDYERALADRARIEALLE